jgi:uncharacterized protein (DUF4415 family)
MRRQYDFSAGRRGAVIASLGKTRVTLMLDTDLVELLRAEAEACGVGYQERVNAALREVLLAGTNRKSE